MWVYGLSTCGYAIFIPNHSYGLRSWIWVALIAFYFIVLHTIVSHTTQCNNVLFFSLFSSLCHRLLALPPLPFTRSSIVLFNSQTKLCVYKALESGTYKHFHVHSTREEVWKSTAAALNWSKFASLVSLSINMAGLGWQIHCSLSTEQKKNESTERNYMYKVEVQLSFSFFFFILPSVRLRI